MDPDPLFSTADPGSGSALKQMDPKHWLRTNFLQGCNVHIFFEK